MTTLIFLLLVAAALFAWWETTDATPDDNRWNGGVPQGSGSSPRFVHNETHQWV